MNEFETRCLNLFDKMIDDHCDMFGVQNTISWLLDCGFTEFEISVKLGFDEEDVKKAIKEHKEDT